MRALTLIVLTGGFGGCSTTPPMQVVDLQEPGWTVRQGQAAWTIPKHKTTFAGELLLAVHANGDVFARFSKGPMTVALAQRDRMGWRLELPAQSKVHSMRGKPPKRILWFQLATALGNSPLDGGWGWDLASDSSWTLVNRRTGETLQGVFFP